MKLDIWDTAGQDEFKSMTRNYYAGSNAVIIVYAVNSYQTFQSVDDYHNTVKSLCAPDTIIAIAGNKCDL